MPAETEKAHEPSEPASRIVIRLAVLAALAAAAVLAVIQIYPRTLATPKNPSFVDNIFDSRIVILIIRVALIFAAGYVVISVVGLIVGRRWLSEFGPFKASEPLQRLGRGGETLESDLGEAVTSIVELRNRLVNSDAALASARSDISGLIDGRDRIEAEKERK